MRTWIFSALAAFALTLLLLRPAAAFTEAGEAYIYPTFTELTQTTLLLGGMDVNEPGVLEQYIHLMYCDLYKQNRNDDFAWHGIQKQILARINAKKEYSRTLYQLGGAVILGPYDFERQMFPLVDGTAFQNVGYMSLFSKEEFKPYCLFLNRSPATANLGKDIFARNINIVLSEPFNLTSFRATPQEAQKLLNMMQKQRVQGRKLYIRFRFRVQSVLNVEKERGAYNKVDLSGEIVSIDLFYDKEMTKWLASLPVR